MRITQEQMNERRKAIIMSAFKLFCEKGIESVSVVEIAKESGVGETTIYRYFENKTTLVLEAFVKLWDMIMRQIEDFAEGYDNYNSLTGYEQISVWIDTFRLLYQNNADFILFSYEAKLYLLRNNVKLDSLQQDILMNPIKGPFLLALEKGKKDGSIPVTEESENVFYAVWGAIRGYIVKIVIYDRLYGEDSPWEKRYPIMKNLILSALKAGWYIS